MQCESCGTTVNKIIARMCVDCYIDTVHPTEVRGTPWIGAFSSFKIMKKPLRENKFDEKLSSAITSMSAKISEDKATIVLEVDEKRVLIPLTVGKLDELAQKSGILVGKWLIYGNDSEINDVWKAIARATFNGELGKSAKVSTAMQNKKRYTICAYTENYLNLDDVTKVRENLRLLGFTDELCYKPDIYTYLGIYYRTTRLSPCRYRE